MSRKKVLLIGLIIVLIIAIPITIFLIRQQQEIRTRAEKATVLSLEPPSTVDTPIQKEVDEVVNLDVYVDPGVNQNLVSFVRLEILYDPTKLAPGGLTEQEEGFTEESSVMSLLEGPQYEEGKITATLSVGVDPTKVIQTKTKIATLTFTTLDGTGDEPTVVSFGPLTQVLSAGEQDETNENVLASTRSAYIAIAGEVSGIIPTPTGVGERNTTPTPTGTSPTPTSAQTQSTTPTPTMDQTGSSTNVPPNCSSLAIDRSATGVAPFSITFTANGTDSDGIITKVTFSFGDGQVVNINQGGGIGTSTVSVAVSHTYQNPGIYTASAVLTDNSGGVSSQSCSQTVTVTDDEGVAGGAETPTSTPTPIPTLPATGPGDVIINIGFLLGVLTLLGGILFFVL